MIVAWRAWYSEGRVFDSAGTAWVDLPSDGALVFCLYQHDFRPDGKPRRRIMDGSDWYFLTEGDAGPLYGQSSVNDSFESVVERHFNGDATRGARFVKRGKWTDEATFDAIQKLAMETPDKPLKPGDSCGR